MRRDLQVIVYCSEAWMSLNSIQDTLLKLADVTIPLANRGGIALRKVSSATGALTVNPADTNGLAEDEKSRPGTPQISDEKPLSSPVVSGTKEVG